jgi:hypothetical protein
MAGVGGSMLIGGFADAAYTGISSNVEQVDIAGFGAADVIRLYATFDSATDRLDGVLGNAVFPLSIATTDGSDFYQDPNGGDTADGQVPANIGLFPDLVYDSYLDIGKTLSIEGGSVFLAPGFPSAGWGTGGAGLSTTNGSWTRFPFDPLGMAGADFKVLFAQITVARDRTLEGTVNFNVTQGGTPGVLFGQTFSVPAPGALALLGVAGVAGSRRRRRA